MRYNLVGYSRETNGQYKTATAKRWRTGRRAITAGQCYSAAHKTTMPTSARISGPNRRKWRRQKLTSAISVTARTTSSMRYPMDALMDATDMFKAKYQFFGRGAIRRTEHRSVPFQSQTEWEPFQAGRRASATMVSLVDAIKGYVPKIRLRSPADVTVGIDLDMERNRTEDRLSLRGFRSPMPYR